MIRANADAEIRALIDTLGDAEARREAAIARLIILGSRAVPRLVSAHGSTTDRGRQLAILRVLQASADERALPIAETTLQTGGDLGVAAVGVLTGVLDGATPAAHARALDILLSASNDPRLERRVRAAAGEALARAPRDIRDAVGGRLAVIGSHGDAVWDDAVEGRLPEDPATLVDALDGHAERAPLPCLLRVIEAVRAREAAGDPRRAAWQAARGALHEMAAARGSRVALYDLRETLEAARGALPASFLSAAQLIGDPSCVESLAVAWSRAGEARWQQQLTDTFHALVHRLKLTRRHAAMRRALGRAPGLSRTM